MGSTTKKIWLAARLLISTAIVCYLVTLLDWQRFGELLTTMRVGMVMLAPLALLCGYLFAAWRWRILLQGLEINLGLGPAYLFYLKGLFYGSVLPGVLGGDVVRVGLAKGETSGHLAELTSSVLIERLAGILALLLIGGAGALLTTDLFPADIQTGAAWPMQIAALATVVGLTLGLAVLPHIPRRWFETKKDKGLFASLVRIMGRVVSLSRWRVLAVIVGSICFQGLDIVTTYLLAEALGLSVPFSAFLFVIPIVYLATVLPISLGGLGVREGVIVFFFVGLGVPTSDAVSLSFVIYFNRIIVALIGGLLQLVWRGGKRSG